MGKVFTKEQMEKELLRNHPLSKLKVLESGSLQEPLKIQCLECDSILCFEKAEQAKWVINICKEKHFSSGGEKRKYFSQKYGFKIIEEKNRKIKLLCLNCGKEHIRGYSSFLSYPEHCPHCNTVGDKQKNTPFEAQEKIDKRFGESEYSLIKYQSYHEKALIKHRCGFSWSQNYSDFLEGKGCPKCFKRKSKGEQQIENWLMENNFCYISQKSLECELKRFKFDFFLPEFNLAIEYQGEQHYKDKKGFFEDLEVIQKRDNIKKEYCRKKGIELLEISYLDYKKIPEILSSRFNDYSQEVASNEAKQTTT